MAQLTSLADAPGTLREYETIYILNPDTLNDKVADVNSKLKGIIEDQGGRVLKVDNWGKRRLSYEIAKQRKGIYLYWQYLGNPDIVAEFERNMRMLDSVIRYMTVKIDADIDPGARPSELDEDSYERAATTAADEEDLMLGEGASASDEEEGEAAEGEAAESEAAEGEAVEAAASEESEASEPAASAEPTASADEDTEK